MVAGAAESGIRLLQQHRLHQQLSHGRLPQNLVQAMRDCFGSHTYQRVDKEGTFHTEWLD